MRAAVAADPERRFQHGVVDWAMRRLALPTAMRVAGEALHVADGCGDRTVTATTT